jgi:cell wall-associated NlpC family hydrolase
MLNERRQKVLQVAGEWVGTPFHHLQRCKGAGVDCGQFLLGVFEECGFIPHVKTAYYPRDFHLHRSEEWYKSIVERFSRPITMAEALPADLVLYRVGRVFSHGGIIVEWPRIIHSYVTRGVIYADGTQGHLMSKARVFYRPLMLEDEMSDKISEVAAQ